jgi:hypothetical protein
VFIYIYLKFNSAIRKNETMWSEGKWILLEDIMLSEESQAQKAKAICFLSYVENRHNTKISTIMKNR